MTLRITVEIVPFGDEDRKRVLGVLNVSNITIPNEANERGAIADYVVRGHRRSDGFWPLVREVINRAAASNP